MAHLCHPYSSLPRSSHRGSHACSCECNSDRQQPWPCRDGSKVIAGAGVAMVDVMSPQACIHQLQAMVQAGYLLL